MTIEELAGRLSKSKPRIFGKGPGIVGRCPSCERQGRDAHAEHFAAYAGDDGWLHVRCVAGCSESEIQTALAMEPKDRIIDPQRNGKAEKPPRPEGDRYVYTDANGTPLFVKVRSYRWDEMEHRWRKTFWQELPDGSKGLKSIGEDAHTLFHLPALIEAVRAGKPIYICEGEKACLSIEKAGAVATCQPGGAAKGAPSSKWLPQHTEALRGAHSAIIVADRDEVGEEYARYVASQLSGVVQRVDVVQSDTDGEHDDAHDHLMAGRALSELLSRPDLAPARGLATLVYNGQFTPVVLTHLVDPYLPTGKCVLLDADGGVGKSAMSVAWAAAMSRGLHPTTLRALPQGPVRTLYLHKGEDDDAELETVYRANGGQQGMIAYVGEAQCPGLRFDHAGLRMIKEAILDGGFKFIVVDALFYFLTGLAGDGNKAMEVLPVLARMNRVAHETQATFLNIRHTRKPGAQGGANSDAGMGSVQFRNSHRGQLTARWYPDKPGIVLVTDEKGSLLNPRGDHFCYRREGLMIEYVHDLPNPDLRVEVREVDTKLAYATEWLENLLSNAWVLSRHVESLANEKRISGRTLMRARKDLGVVSSMRGEPAEWGLSLPIPDPFAGEKCSVHHSQNRRFWRTRIVPKVDRFEVRLPTVELRLPIWHTWHS